jgi:superfamily II DNA or RNA helicase
VDSSNSRSSRIREIESQLSALEGERKRLVAELTTLQSPARTLNELPGLLGLPALPSAPQTPDEKVDLFLSLFRARESVFPKLWENLSKGKKGYSPACRNEWVSGVCGKPKTKCSECPNQAFSRLDAQAVKGHLQGKATIGTYAILENDTCAFLAADFDGDGWLQDIAAYKTAARELGIKVEVERSRSGNGGHAWIFFQEPIEARTARQLGTVIVARAQASRHTMPLGTYDRFFPSQDTLPRGGFGNLIALPLQKAPRDAGNSVFLTDDLSPCDDQWALLAGARKLALDEVRGVLQRELSDHCFQLVQYEDMAVASAEHALDSGSHKIVHGSYTGQIDVEIGCRLSINTLDLPSSVLSALKRTATFANPEFFNKERLRFSTWNTPRFIFCGEMFPDRLVLPRGTLDACLEIAKKAGSSVVLRDARPNFSKLKATFQGVLSPEQKKAVAALVQSDIGVLVAPPGAGKTVMGCALIAKRKVSTLILVHRTPLMEQWRLRIAEFLGIEPKKIGTFAGTRKKPNGTIDVGMLPSLAKLSEAEVEEMLATYGQIIIDECHHLPAVSFDRVLQKSPARYVIGLTATPYRKDGHQAIIHMQCGPTRYEMKQIDGPAMTKRVVVRETAFKMPDDLGPQPAIHLVWEKLVADPARLDLVARDLREAIERGRFPLVISERKEHLALLQKVFDDRLHDLGAKGFVLIGGMGKKARTATLEQINAALDAKTRPYILATGSFIGEGFDLPALDTLIIAMPISFKGRMIQYAGRLHRASPGKTQVVIYDYLDASSALTVSMFKKRLVAYRKMEYQIEAEAGSWANRMNKNQTDFFSASLRPRLT